ncbi:LIM-domain-containing protein [Phellopilus nigrolimitatus]|nr:LIM-domain-containing protein [Phellopilus nigrolimitatus]
MHPYGGISICPRCEKAVYAAEQIMGPGRMLYHKPCLACTACNKRLDSLSLMEHDKEPYCKQCYNKNFGPRDLRQANLPHRDDMPLPLSSSPVRPTFPGSPTRSYRCTSPTQEEKEVEGRFERAKREPPGRVASPSSPFAANVLAKRAERFKASEEPAKESETSDSDRPLDFTDNIDNDRDGDEGRNMYKSEEPKSGRSTAIPRTIHLSAALAGRAREVVAPNARLPTRFSGSPVVAPRPMTPTSPTSAPVSLSTSPIRPTATGTRYGAALTGTLSTGNSPNKSSPWTNRAMPGTGTPLCARCAKPVYFAEQVKANGRVFHKPCLRCTDCNAALDSSRLAEKGERVVCRNCYGKHYGPQGSGYALLGKAGG